MATVSRSRIHLSTGESAHISVARGSHIRVREGRARITPPALWQADTVLWAPLLAAWGEVHRFEDSGMARFEALGGAGLELELLPRPAPAARWGWLHRFLERIRAPGRTSWT